MELQKSKNEKELINEQNRIKKYETCLAVYDLPIGCDFIPNGAKWGKEGKPYIYVTKYHEYLSKREYKMFVFK